MKRCPTILAVVVTLMAFSVPAIALADGISVYVNGRPVLFDVPPVIEDGRTLVPVRAVMEALGASVRWDQPSRTVFVTNGGVTVSLTIDLRDAVVNGEKVLLDVPARIIDGRTIVPLRFISEHLGYAVNWDPGTRSVHIGAPKGPRPPRQDVEEPVETDEPIKISLPFSEGDRPRDMMPMGETINHPDPPNPGGHPGIDFMWDESVDIIACVDGVVSRIKEAENHKGTWDVYVSTGGFYVGYTTLGKVEEGIKVGSTVTTGQKIGEPGCFGHYMIHWEFGKDTAGPRRICPMAYFDEASRKRILEIWAGVKWPEMKQQFPNICNRYYRCDFCKTNGY